MTASIFEYQPCIRLLPVPESNDGTQRSTAIQLVQTLEPDVSLMRACLQQPP